MITIPMLDQNSFVVEASLDDLTYFLRFDWNSEAQIWVMGISNANNEAVLQGVVLLSNTPLLTQFRHLSVPAGEFIVLAEDPEMVVDRHCFLNRHATLYYLLEEEVASL